jgi:aminoglycoside phosphotransferase (APT) family kinase protein
MPITPASSGFASETIDVKAAHRFDEARLADYLERHVEGFVGPLTVKQFEGGQSNPTYFLQTPARNYVLRRKPPGRLVKSAHAVDREYRVIRALNQTDFPVPRAYLLCEDESVIGTAFFLMSHVAGHARADVSMPDLAPAARRQLVDSYVDTLARLHGFDPVALGLGDFGPPGNYFARQVSRWSRQFAETETEKVPEMHELIAWLESAIPGQARTSIVHGDYSFNNVLSHPSEPRVAAVLDWELSTIGDPLADFTYFTQPWFAPPGERSFAGRDLAALGIPDYAAVRDRYCERMGQDSIPHEHFYRAFHAFRSSAILQGIIKRAIDGTAAGAMALAFTPADVRAGAIRGLDYARRG